MYRKGTNKYSKRMKPIWKNIFSLILLVEIAFVFYCLKHRLVSDIIRPVVPGVEAAVASTPTESVIGAIGVPLTATATPAPEATPTPSELEEVIAYIVRIFEPEGKDVVVKAINCFYSESGLRPEAYNKNRNGTEDRGVAQINSLHGLTAEEAHDIYKNIDKAYNIYKSRGFDAWYGKLCQ